MKNLQVTAENFSAIRETLKAGETCKVNEKVTLMGYIANTEKVNESGKKTRTPFYYITEKGAQLTSTQLKEKLGIEAETKGSRKETTFASIWEQAEKLAKQAGTEELRKAIKALRQIIDERALEAEKAEKAEKEKAAKILGFASYDAYLKATAKPKRERQRKTSK